jgi:hypothetical protein
VAPLCSGTSLQWHLSAVAPLCSGTSLQWASMTGQPWEKEEPGGQRLEVVGKTLGDHGTTKGLLLLPSLTSAVKLRLALVEFGLSFHSLGPGALGSEPRHTFPRSVRWDGWYLSEKPHTEPKHNQPGQGQCQEEALSMCQL